jgi:hypothetical protein
MGSSMGNKIFAHAILDQFEGRIGGGQNAFRWEGQARIGGDYDKLWLKSEGFALGRGGVEDSRNELLYDRAVSTYLDLQAGVRTDWDSGTGRTWAAFGVQGLAPFFFDYEATGYLSDGGHTALRLAASYDLLITQRLILQPEVEMNVYSKADPGRKVGAGFSDIDAGLRLRYEAGNLRPISASPMQESSAKRRASPARMVKAPARCSSSSASGAGSDARGHSHPCHRRHSGHGRHVQLYLRRYLRCIGDMAALADHLLGDGNGASAFRPIARGRHRAAAHADG